MFFKIDLYCRFEGKSDTLLLSYEGEDIDLLNFLKSLLDSFKSSNPSQVISLDAVYMKCHLDTLEGTYDHCLENILTFTSEAIRYIRETHESIKNENPHMNK